MPSRDHNGKSHTAWWPLGFSPGTIFQTVLGVLGLIGTLYSDIEVGTRTGLLAVGGWISFLLLAIASSSASRKASSECRQLEMSLREKDDALQKAQEDARILMNLFKFFQEQGLLVPKQPLPVKHTTEEKNGNS